MDAAEVVVHVVKRDVGGIPAFRHRFHSDSLNHRQLPNQVPRSNPNPSPFPNLLQPPSYARGDVRGDFIQLIREDSVDHSAETALVATFGIVRSALRAF